MFLPAGVTEEDGIYTYRCPASDTQALEVKLRSSDCSVLSWKLVSTIEWKQDDSLTVWDGT